MMKKILILMTLFVLVAVFSFGTVADARPPFDKGFKDMYYKPKSKDPNEKKLADAIDKLVKDNDGKSCTICHVGKSKKDRNAYGEEMKKLITGKDLVKDEKKDNEKIADALKKLADVKSPAGPKYDEILKKGELPVTGDKK